MKIKKGPDAPGKKFDDSEEEEGEPIVKVRFPGYDRSPDFIPPSYVTPPPEGPKDAAKIKMPDWVFKPVEEDKDD